MSHVYCQECGAKHILGAKFCSACGNPFDKKAAAAKKASKPALAQSDEEGAEAQLVVPSKLEYEIVNNAKNRFSVEEVVRTPPSQGELRPRPNNVRNLSEKEYLTESLKECAPRKEPIDIDES